MGYEESGAEQERAPQVYSSPAELPPGWAGLAQRLRADLVTLGWSGHEGQITRKGATLRVQGDDPGMTGAMIERIWRASWESARTCEHCGRAGRLRGHGLGARTRCNAHAAGLGC